MNTVLKRNPQHAHPLWHNTQYRRWFAADTAAAMGMAMKSFAISLVAFSLTQSLALSGWLGTVTMLAAQTAGIFGGTVVDRHDRRTLIIINALCGMALWGLAFALLALNLLNFAAFAVITVVASTINGLLQGATNAMLRSIIPTEQYPKAQSLNQGRDSVISLAGSPLGGVLYAVAPWLPFAAASLMYAVCGASAARLADAGNGDHGDNGEPPAAHGSFLADFAAGWRWTLRRRTLLTLTAIASLVNLGINGIFATVNLHLVGTHVDAVRIGLVEMAMGAGTLLGALIAAKVADRMPLGTGMVVVSTVALATLAPMLFSDGYAVVLVCALLVSVPIPVVNSLIMGFVFAKVPSDMQGRAGSALGLLCMLPALFCSAIAGSLLPLVGFGATIGLFLAVLAVNVAIVLAVPTVRSLPAADRWDDAAL